MRFGCPQSVGAEASKIALQTQEAEVSARPLDCRLEEKQGFVRYWRRGAGLMGAVL